MEVEWIPNFFLCGDTLELSSEKNMSIDEIFMDLWSYEVEYFVYFNDFGTKCFFFREKGFENCLKNYFFEPNFFSKNV